MTLPKKYNPQEVEPRLQKYWQTSGVYQFQRNSPAPVFSVDTPPPTVSGTLHIGHVYSYTHADIIARFRRMQGWNVFYPMGFDDNGLPTERLVEKQLGLRAEQMEREAFIEACLATSERAIQEYRALWQRLGLSVDWRHTYRTIDEYSQRTSQISFLDLYEKGLAYQRKAPAIWCPECRTAIAQAELEDMERATQFLTLAFRSTGDRVLPISTTRPELLPACVAVFVHPSDPRYGDWVGSEVQLPIFDRAVPVLEDHAADPEKGTGAVMCCTFGDTVDVSWWYTYNLDLVEAIDDRGRMTSEAREYTGLPLREARARIAADLEENGDVLGRERVYQTVRIHERCDTPVEYIVTRQWFIRVLDYKEELLRAGEQVEWIPRHMLFRYRSWVENLNWDWCISRQRYFGVPIPVWYCVACGEVVPARAEDLPVNPLAGSPGQPCPTCGGAQFEPERDVMDTWATSSMSPQIAGRWLQGENPDPFYQGLYKAVFPFSIRPQAHEIIRTWAFYTIVKSHYHFRTLPWKQALISGWGIAAEGQGKISKSRGGGPLSPEDAIATYSADAVRYWASSVGPGRDAIISEEKIQAGVRLATKLWNIARFSKRFLVIGSELDEPLSADLSAADRWLLSSLQRLTRHTTQYLEEGEYAAARSEIETFIWKDLADNYLEMAKQRLYQGEEQGHEAARFTLSQTLHGILLLLAPFLPYITEELYQRLYVGDEGRPGGASIHSHPWPQPDARWIDPDAEELGSRLVDITSAVRRYKSERGISLGTPLKRLQLAADDAGLREGLLQASPDLASVSRAECVEISSKLPPDMAIILEQDGLRAAVLPKDFARS